MADHSATVERSFDAGHHLPGDDECWAEGHGHRWTVAVTIRGRFDPKIGRSVDVAALSLSLDDIAKELDGKSHNVMMPAGRPTPEGIGLWILERLLPEWPKIIEVKVWRDPRVSFSIQREPR